MHIEFVYRYLWNTETRAYYVTYDDGVTVVRVFLQGVPGIVVSPVPTSRLAEIQAHIDAAIAMADAYPSVEAGA